MNFWAMSSGESERTYMMDSKSEAMVKSLEDLLAEKRVVGRKERELVQSLSAALRKMGYKVVPIYSAKPRRPGRPPKRRGPGRPPKAARQR